MLVQQMRAAIEADLRQSLDPLQKDAAQPIADMISYHLGWKQPGAEGKRIRPIFTLLCCAAVGGDWEIALPAASAIEWIHNFSLIHDDIQDQSATRRGRQTLWAREGVAQSINTGDAVFALAHLTSQRLIDTGLSASTTLEILGHLDRACLELTIGQHLDLEFETRPSVGVADYLEMIAGKTGALLELACMVGALIGGSDHARALRFGEFGLNIGLAFQMYDDLLGIWGDSLETGKPAGDDLLSRKKTFPLVFGMQTSSDVSKLWAGDLENEIQIQEMIRALEDAGAKTHVLQQAETFTSHALSALEKAQPLQPYRQELEDLSQNLLQRVS